MMRQEIIPSGLEGMNLLTPGFVAAEAPYRGHYMGLYRHTAGFRRSNNSMGINTDRGARARFEESPQKITKKVSNSNHLIFYYSIFWLLWKILSLEFDQFLMVFVSTSLITARKICTLLLKASEQENLKAEEESPATIAMSQDTALRGASGRECTQIESTISTVRQKKIKKTEKNQIRKNSLKCIFWMEKISLTS